MRKYVIAIIIVILLGIIAGLCIVKFTGDSEVINMSDYMLKYNYTINENEVTNSEDKSNTVSNFINAENTNIVLTPTNTENQNHETPTSSEKFELPLNGTTAFASVTLPLYKNDPSATSSNSTIKNLKPRRSFYDYK